jgi:ferredoxin-type protein NapH
MVEWEATAIPDGVDEWDFRIGNTADLLFPITKQAAGAAWHNYRASLLLVILVMAIAGALISFFPLTKGKPGVKNNHIMFRGITARGWAGIIIGIYLIAFYVVLYWFPEYIVQWTLLTDDLSIAISGNPASQWFVYGLLYTLCILVMGIRMLIKYRHSKYQQVRTVSVMFFQTAFAFMIPEILVRLNQPYYDFKNIWPLNYDFFYDWNLNQLISSGLLGQFMLIWGILLIVVAVPAFSYFYGKRWYCSWVCGCGGLAETLGDPFRHLSDKSIPAWKIERWMVHGVLVFAVFMTALVLYTYFTGNSRILGLDSYHIRSWYGFLIGAAFAGVVGVGFYPFMGNRVWCRFGCPLAAYIGLIQRFKSRFRITVNKGQCISCGNCSAYCEMGIDVRWYAQRGQDVVRASCVGCGICSEVCPRGVLRLENASADINTRASSQRVLHLSEEGVNFNA